MLLFNVQDNNTTSDMKFDKIWVSVLVSVSAKLLSLDLKDLENNIEGCIYQIASEPRLPSVAGKSCSG